MHFSISTSLIIALYTLICQITAFLFSIFCWLLIVKTNGIFKTGLLSLQYWLLGSMKVIFKLTFKREVVTSLLKHNCFHYFYQVLFVIFIVWMLLWILFFLLILVLWIFLWILLTVKYYDSQDLNEKLKLIGLAIFFFWKSYWAAEYLALWSPRLQNVFFLNFVKPSNTPPLPPQKKKPTLHS